MKSAPNRTNNACQTKDLVEPPKAAYCGKLIEPAHNNYIVCICICSIYLSFTLYTVVSIFAVLIDRMHETCMIISINYWVMLLAIMFLLLLYIIVV